jgi:hypothetical protein
MSELVGIYLIYVVIFLSSSLPSKNLKIKIYRNIILPIVFLWVWNLVADFEGEM